MQPHEKLNALLGKTDYDPAILAKEVLEQEWGAPVGEVCTVLMALGHVELAQSLVEHGVCPTGVDDTALVFYPSRRHLCAPGHHGRASLLHFLVRHHPGASGGRVKSASEVIEALKENPSLWPLQINGAIDGRTALMWAVSRSQATLPDRETVLEGLLALGEDPNAQLPNFNVLAAACQYELQSPKPGEQNSVKAAWQACLQEMERVRNWGVDFSNNPHIALAAAMQYDAFTSSCRPWGPRTQALLDHGVLLQCPTHAPSSVSLYAKAIEQGNVAQVKALLDAGVDPAWVDPETGNTLVYVAFKGGAAAQKAFGFIPTRLLEPVCEHLSNSGQYPIHQAAMSLNFHMVNTLLEAGADINRLNSKGELPLQAVRKTGQDAQASYPELVNYLESQGAVAPGKTPGALLQAIQIVSDDLVEKFIGQGADVKECAPKGLTPLMLLAQQQCKLDSLPQEQRAAVEKRMRRIASLLLDAGACPQALDAKGASVLYHATAQGCAILVEELLHRSADPVALDKARRRPFQVATERGWQGTIPTVFHERIVRAYLEAGLIMEDYEHERTAFSKLIHHPRLESLVDTYRQQRLLNAQTSKASPSSPRSRL